MIPPPDLVLLVRSGPVIRDLGGSVHIWGDNGPVLISYFYDGAVPVKVFQNRSQSGFIWIIDSTVGTSVCSDHVTSWPKRQKRANRGLHKSCDVKSCKEMWNRFSK